MKYCPPSYVLCVSSHFWPFIIVKVVLEKLDKNLGSVDPPPSVGPNSQIFPKIRFEGSPYGRPYNANNTKTTSMTEVKITLITAVYTLYKYEDYLYKPLMSSHRPQVRIYRGKNLERFQ